MEEIKEMPDIRQGETISISVESDGVDIFGIAICTKGSDYYYDIRRSPNIIEWLNEKARCGIYAVVGHNLKEDLRLLKSHGVYLRPERCDCIQVRASLIDEHLESYTLEFLSEKYLSERVGESLIYEKLAFLFGGLPTRRAQYKNLGTAPTDIISSYSIRKARIVYDLWKWQEKKIYRSDHFGNDLTKIWELEKELFPVVFDMESRGIRIDENALAKEPNKAFKKSLEKHVVNGRVYPTIHQTKGEDGGSYTGRMSMSNPAVQQVPANSARAVFLPEKGHLWGRWDYCQQDFRMLAEYINDPKINEIFEMAPNTDFHSIVSEITRLPRDAAKGRANAKEFNFAAMYDMSEGRLAKMMGMDYTEERKTFDIPLQESDIKGKRREGYACLSRHPKKTFSFKEKGIDYHCYIKGDRVYKRFHKDILIPGKEAKEIIDHYHEKIPGIKDFSRKASMRAKERGYLGSIFGRKLRFDESSYYKAKAIVCQGSSADCIKKKKVEVFEFLEGKNSRILFSVYDEINVSIDPKEYDEIVNEITLILEDEREEKTLPLRIRLRTKFKKGRNWAEASSFSILS